jgi:hypothetical protein
MSPQFSVGQSWPPHIDLRLRAFSLSVIAVAAALFSYFAFVSPSMFLFPDALYYDAVANGLETTGMLLDPSTLPAKPIYSPQNGIVFINAALGSISYSIRYVGIAALGFLALATSTLFLFRILARLGLETTTTSLVIAAFLSSPLLLRVAAAPLNDVFFIALYIGGLLGLTSNSLTVRMIVMSALALVMGIFRLQGIVLFFAAALVAWRISRKEAVLCLLLAAVNASVPFLIDELLSKDNAHTFRIAGEILSFKTFVNNLIYMMGQALPKLLTAAGPKIENYTILLLPIGAVVYLLIARRTWISTKLKRREAAIVSAATLGTMLFVLVTPYYDPRYYLCVYPFILLVPLLPPCGNAKIRDTIFICACLANLLGLGGRLLYSEVDFSQNRSAAENLRLNAPNAIPLYSEDPYLGYFVFQRASMAACPNYTDKSDIILFGRPEWRTRIVQQLQNRYSIAPHTSQAQLIVRFAPTPDHHGMTILRHSP